jgi:hypothetical protein
VQRLNAIDQIKGLMMFTASGMCDQDIVNLPAAL